METSQAQEQFQALLEAHKKILYKVCSAYCTSPHDREDLAQEIVLQLWRSFGSFDGRVRFSTWMYRVALNVAISSYRRERARSGRVLSNEDVLLTAGPDAAREPEDAIMLDEFIRGLDPLNKALVLLYLEDQTYKEIAAVLGISETNVATKIARIKAAMRQQLTVKGA